MDAIPHPRAWRIAAPALLGWNVLGGAVGATIVVLAVQGSPGDATAALAPDSFALTLLVVAVAAILGAVGGLLGGGTLVLARGRRPTARTVVRGVAAGLVVAALVVLAALHAPIMPDATRPIAVVVGLAIGAVMLGLAFQARTVHWREEEPRRRELPGGDAPVSATDPIRDLVDPDPHAADDDVAAGR